MSGVRDKFCRVLDSCLVTNLGGWETTEAGETPWRPKNCNVAHARARLVELEARPLTALSHAEETGEK